MAKAQRKRMKSLPSVSTEATKLTPLEVVEPRNQFDRTWEQELERLQPYLATLDAKDRDAEIKYQWKLFQHFSQPLPAAERRQTHLAETYQAIHPSQRRRRLDALQKNWT